MASIRRATHQDAPSIEALLLGEARHITLHPDGTGAELVLASMRRDAIERNITEGHYCYWVHLHPDNGRLQGLLGLRGGTHLYQLFVRSNCHFQGIGRALWTNLFSDWPTQWEMPERITVNASPYGFKAYRSYGFEQMGDYTEINGVAFMPMLFKLPSEKLSQAHP